jgi:hypothetical protein
MKQNFLMIFLLAISISSRAQDKMIIDKSYNGNTFYGKFSVHISSMSETPSVIQFNVTGFLNKILSTMSSNVKFSHGQIVDLKGYFSKDSLTYSYGWAVPKYDLNFILQDTTIGIKNYYLQIRLDENGQILYANWPKEHYSDKNKFKSRTDIEQYALKKAKEKGFEINNYKVDLKYNEKLDKLCWVFIFPMDIGNNGKDSNVFEIDWKSLVTVDEYIMTKP